MTAVTEEIVLNADSGGGGAPREQHPTGQHVAVCVDVINLGERLEEFAGKSPKIVQKIAFVFMTGLKDKEGRLFELSKEMTLSSGERATLPKFIGEWRGAPLTAEEIKRGIKLSEFVGKPVTLNIAMQRSKKGTEYSKITTATAVHPLLLPSVPQLPDYTRAPFWETRKGEYADEVAEFRRKQAVASAPTARASIAQAPTAPVSDEAAVAKMIASETAAQDSDLPPF